MPIDDAAIRRIVLSHPIPDRLLRNLRDAEVRLVISPARYEILKLAAQGLSVSEIAARRGISRDTVKQALDILYRRLGVHTQAALVAVCYRERIV